ncbi:AmmeMemoRadiSam system radical SAM enzyme [Anaerocolumna sedimenticola]|uniref:AmmeMemoRadiSam system radical SAM enzyme n=1 Tax=Anaerocolumna sedimenticola TaxID=2696063 RepID=A0A6P1TR63_9FIRM|nr:AmmeMemoRadiSam system radical SAM enzyme [Anaerocolumna sedimenticola]QHQ62391.1 AmmeMemoRadiSam system radical SAM enzyme [Anaerocolumna sedimenticola]
MSRVICNICPHYCNIEENHIGFCGARSNADGKIIPINYGLLTGIALDPIEKKPLYHFNPGSQILSVGSFGCNFRCSFCQNYEISMAKKEQVKTQYVSPKEVIRMAKELQPEGNIGIAYTYNEPLVGFEYVYDCAKLARKEGLKNVLVTNGYINEDPFLALLEYLDALNIDLKAFNEKLYKNLSGGLEIVKHSIELSAKKNHVEVTTLVVPGDNDSDEEIRDLSVWLASVRKDIPLHLTRFFPRYKMRDREATKVSRIYELADIARESLLYVYEGNC